MSAVVPGPPVVATERRRAMGCEVVVVGPSERELTAIRELFARRERTFSRFLATSELSRVNGSPATTLVVSEEFAAGLGLALRAAAESGGVVDPTLARALEAAGYDRDLAVLEPADELAPAGPRGAWREVRLVGRYLTRPAGLRLDLNGVVKSMTVDDAAALLPGDGFVSAGGDLRAVGETVVAVPGGELIRVAGGVATSGTDRRRWISGGVEQHHLIDPSTGRPSSSPWRLVTVAASTCVGADVAAKTALLLGAAGPDWLEERGVAARFVAADGVRRTSAWPGPEAGG